MPSSLLERETFAFAADGSIPNNPRLAFLIYRGGIKGMPDPQPWIESTFASNDWGEMGRSGIGRCIHLQSMIEEAMGPARGRSRMAFDGKNGAEIDIFGGDVCVQPAGPGHHGAWATPDVVVIGPYRSSSKYDLCRDSRAEHARAIAAIAEVPMPQTDPVSGRPGPLTRLWHP